MTKIDKAYIDRIGMKKMILDGIMNTHELSRGEILNILGAYKRADQAIEYLHIDLLCKHNNKQKEIAHRKLSQAREHLDLVIQ